MLRIRLRRTGKKHQPHYRIVVAEHTAPVSGKYVGILGHYNPRSKDIVIDNAAVTMWLDRGAQPSNTIAKLLTKQGMKHKLIKIHLYPERPGKNVEPEKAPVAAAEPAEATDVVVEESADATEAEPTPAETVTAEETPTPEAAPADAPAETPTPDTQDKE